MENKFDYSEAFSRNVGWVTKEELEVLRHKRIAIAGLGGVGGVHLITLARFGIANFNISDMDVFELANFNRQYGANMTTIDKPKCEVMKERVLEINPEADIKTFGDGINDSNVEEFLSGCDLYVDGMDLFCMPTRSLIFNLCAKLNIPGISVAPLGLSAAMFVAMPEVMSYEEYFGLEGLSEDDVIVHFLAGIAPRFLHINYIADPSKVDLENQKGPSTPASCQLCSGVCATEAIKILLNRPGVTALPRTVQFDAYRQKLAKTWRPGGNRNPIQQALIAFIKWKLQKMKNA